MSLCDDQTVEKLNRYFIPCFVDDIANAPLDRIHAPADAPPVLQAAYTNTVSLLRRAMVVRPGETMRSGVQSYIVRLDGTIEQGPEMMGPEPETLVSRVLDKVLAETPVEPGKRVARYVSQAPERVPEGGVQLRMIARFSHPPSERELRKMDASFGNRPGMMYKPALLHPMRDWVVLSEPQWRRLLPPSGAGVGSTYAIDERLAGRIFIHFTSASSAMYAEDAYMETAHLTGRVERSDATGTRVVFTAQFRMKNPGMHDTRGATVPPIDNHIEADVTGFLQTDGSGRLIDIAFATERAVDRAPSGFEMPFEAVAYRVDINADGASVPLVP